MNRTDELGPLGKKMNEQKLWGALICGLLALAGCGGTSVNPIGGGPSAGSFSGDSSAGAGGGASSTTAWANPVQRAGTWLGYVENYQFNDQSDVVTLVLDRDGTGQITFGSSPQPEPFSDPSVGYPKSKLDADGNELVLTEGVGVPVPGYAFPIQNASGDESRLRFDVAFSDVWLEWCTAQTPFHQGLALNGEDLDEYACVPNWPNDQAHGCSLQDPMTMEWVPLDCTKFSLCVARFCACTARECVAANVGSAHFDLDLGETKAEGSFRGVPGGIGFAGFQVGTHNVYLTKQ